MGTISHLHERTRVIARRLESDDEALETARELAAELSRQASDRDMNRILPHDEIASLSGSGLLGIAVPAEHDGLDISNSILAEIVAILSAADPSIAEVMANHFRVLEMLRAAGNADQKRYFFARAMAGDRFTGALSTNETKEKARLSSEGLGFRLSGGNIRTDGILFSDWIAVNAIDEEEGAAVCLVPRVAEGVQIIDDWDGFGQRTNGRGTLILHDVRLDSNAVLHPGNAEGSGSGSALADLVAGLLHAATNLGIARAAFADLLDSTKGETARHPSSDDALALAGIGKLVVHIDAAGAALTQAGEKVDIAQVTTTADHLREATLSVMSAKLVTAEVAAEASNALFELTEASSVRIGRNLDRHWRNARAHGKQDAAQWSYHSLGLYHVRGTEPPR